MTQTGSWKERYEQAELADVACPGCKERRPADIATEFGIAISRCQACGLVYTRTPLREPQAHYLVPKDAYLRKYGDIFSGKSPHPRDRNYDELLRLLGRLTTPGDLLDVGSHCGFFLRRARSTGWRTVGAEPSPVSSALAREQYGLDVRTGWLEEAGLPSARFDAVTVIDVLEHIADPNALLAEIRLVLRPSGFLLVKVPNVRYVRLKHHALRKVPGLISDAFDAREHLVHYSRRSLGDLLTGSGFAVFAFHVPRPIQAGGRPLRLLRGAGSAVARVGPRGIDSPLATDLVAIARPLLPTRVPVPVAGRHDLRPGHE
jgi:SAM-dependent methyltransferase